MLKSFIEKYNIHLFVFIIFFPSFIYFAKSPSFCIFFNICLSIYFLVLNKYNLISYDLIRKNALIFFLGLCFFIIQIIPLKLGSFIFLSPKSHYYYQNISDNGLWFISLNPILSIKYLSLFISCYLIFLITPNIIKKVSSLNIVFSTIMWIGLIHSIYGLLMYFFQLNDYFFYKKISNINSVSGFFVNRNNFSLFLNIILVILVNYLSFYDKHYIKNNNKSFIYYLLSDISIIRISILIIGIAIVLTKSRIGNITFVSFLVFSLLSELFYKKKFTFLSKIILTMIIADILIISSFLGLDNLIERFAETSFENEIVRKDVFIFGLDKFREFFLFGYGLGNFETIFRLEFINFNFLYDHVHNDFIEYLGELGLIFSLYFLILLILFTRNIIKIQKNQIIKNIMFGMILLIMIHGNFDFSLHMPPIIILCSFIFSLNSCLIQKSKK